MQRRRAGDLSFLQQGDRGSVLLLVHGFPLDASMWREQLKGLAGDAQLIAPDLRGFGESEPLESADPLLMDRLADDLAVLLDDLKISEPVAICGLSMGGYVALAFWQRHGRRLSGLALCDSKAAADTDEARAARQAAAESALAGEVDKLCRAMAPKLFARESLQAAPQRVAETTEAMCGTAATTFAAAQRGMARRADMTARVAQIELPALLLCGAADSISTPDEMRRIAEAMPRAEFVEIAAAGHLAPLEQPAAVNQALRRWLLCL